MARLRAQKPVCVQLDQITKTHHCIKWEYSHKYITDCLICRDHHKVLGSVKLISSAYMMQVPLASEATVCMTLHRTRQDIGAHRLATF
jgi:hypothetical protein